MLANEFVKVINFTNIKLRGNFIGLFKLRKLRHLILQDTEISGEIDSCVWDFPKVSILDISANVAITSRINLVIDDSMCKGVSLRALLLTRSQPSGILPSCIGNLAELEELRFDNCLKIFGEVTETICQLSKLKYLQIRDSNISGVFPECIGNMTKLREYVVPRLRMKARPHTYSEGENHRVIVFPQAIGIPDHK